MMKPNWVNKCNSYIYAHICVYIHLCIHIGIHISMHLLHSWYTTDSFYFITVNSGDIYYISYIHFVYTFINIKHKTYRNTKYASVYRWIQSFQYYSCWPFEIFPDPLMFDQRCPVRELLRNPFLLTFPHSTTVCFMTGDVFQLFFHRMTDST